MIIGRKKELEQLVEAYESEYSEFVAVYGRRRVGKTFLVREAFDYRFTFQHAGLSKSNMKKQLAAWKSSLADAGMKVRATPKSWIDAFDLLKELIRNSEERKKVVFIAEMPWMDTKRSEFVPALEHFWNGWASSRKDVLLIVCGSATSWIINKVIKNHGGLHNRVTHKVHLKQFTLKECEEYAESLKLKLTRKQVMECYMVMGGVPFYWSLMNKRLSMSQNLDALFFDEDAVLKGEFDELYSSLFREPDIYVNIVRTLGEKRVGMLREELIGEGNIADTGHLSQALEDLEYCGFIRRYNLIGRKKKGAVFQLTDFYTLFYFKFIQHNVRGDRQFWSKSINTPMHAAWCGLAFERVCLLHVDQIKRALSIGGVQSSESAWYSTREKRDDRRSAGAQIDLLIDRNDDVIDVCEMKYYQDEVVLDEEEVGKIENRMLRLREETGTEKAIHAILVTTKGLKRNAYSDVVQDVVTMSDLFGDF